MPSWARAPRERLLRARGDVLETAARAAVALDDAPTAAGYAADAVAADPLREPAALVHAQALAASGDRAGALAALDRLRARLRDELGVDPSPEWARARQALLGGASAGAAIVRAAADGPRSSGSQLRLAATSPGGRAGPRVRGPGLRRARRGAAPGCVPRSAARGRGGALRCRRGRQDAARGRGDPGRRPAAARLPRAFLPERDEAWGWRARSCARRSRSTRTSPPGSRRGSAPRCPSSCPRSTAPRRARRRGPSRARPRGRRRAPRRRASATAPCSWSTTCSGPTPAASPSSPPRWPGCPAWPPSSPSGPTSRLSAPRAWRCRRSRRDRCTGRRPRHPHRRRRHPGCAPRRRARRARGRPAALRGAAHGDRPHSVRAGRGAARARGAGARVAGPDGRWRPARRHRRRAGDERGSAGPATGRAPACRAGDRRARARSWRSSPSWRGRRTARVAGDGRRRSTPARRSTRCPGSPRPACVRLGEQGWATAHDLVGETVTAALAPGERGRLHGTAGQRRWRPRTPTPPRSLATTATRATAPLRRPPSSGPPTGRWPSTPPGRRLRTPKPGWRCRRVRGLFEVRAQARAAHGDVAGSARRPAGGRRNAARRAPAGCRAPRC